jgi:hypothetical protein
VNGELEKKWKKMSLACFISRNFPSGKEEFQENPKSGYLVL